MVFVKRLTMGQQASVIWLSSKGSGSQNPYLHHMPGRSNQECYGRL
jgi:hypothetical protein